MKISNLILIAAASLKLAGGSASADGVSPKILSFLDQHCIGCHDEDISKGDLDLASLNFEPGKPANFAIWQRVFDRVRDGEMPPEKKPRPEEAKKALFLAGLGEPLVKADLADIKAKGRVQSRRLTRVEYEHTLHDLLGIDIPLAESLPEDPVSHGFQTVADGQQLSHHHLARFLDVADLALEKAFDRALDGDAQYKKFHTPADLAKKRGGNYRGPDLRDGESIAWPLTVQFYGRVPATIVPASGWYRVTIKGVHGVNPGKDGAVWGSLMSGVCYSNAPMLYQIGSVEATAKKRDLVYDSWIREGHILRLIPDDGELKKAPSGAGGGNVSFDGRDLKKQGFSGIAHSGIEVERIYPNADRATVQKHLFGDVGVGAKGSGSVEAANKLVGRFARRAFRRPVTEEQLAPYRKLAKEALADGESLSEALRVSYRAILCSPRFLTFIEAPGELDNHALASRLSYTFWVSMPDWPLIQLANKGELKKPEVLMAQVERMLNDPKAERFIESFSDQWLNLRDIAFTSPDRRQFPSFDPVVQDSMLAETRTYIAQLIKANLGADNLVDSDFVFLNGRLARHYRMTGVKLEPGKGLQKVVLPKGAKNIRGGLLTQGAILKVTADGTTTSPVVRGVFVNERILGQRIPPPPPNVPAIEPDIRGATTVREQLDKHRDNTSCYSCHITIDPPGLALENFDPVGVWRTKYGIKGKGKPVDPAGTTPGGEKFADLIAWKKIYRERDAQLARGFAEQFLTYATGAPMRFGDREVVEGIVGHAEGEGYGVRAIIRAAIASPIMRNK